MAVTAWGWEGEEDCYLVGRGWDGSKHFKIQRTVKEKKKLYLAPNIYCVKVYKPYCNQNQSQGPSCYTPTPTVGSPGGAGVKSRLPLQGMWVRALGREDPLEEEWQPTPVFSPGESHGQRNLAGSPYGHKSQT